MTPTTTLAIETSTAHGSVAVWLSREIIFSETFVAERRHSASLFAALERARGEVSRIEQIVVGLGPGSYAGVRIGIAAALGLGMALQAKIVGIPSIAAMETSSGAYLFVGDARRETFYFAAVENGECIEGPLLASEEVVRAAIGRFSSYPFLSSETLAAFPTSKLANPSAAILARLAAEECGIIQKDDLEPLYLREPNITQPSNTPVRQRGPKLR